MNWWALLAIWLLVNALFVVLLTPVRKAAKERIDVTSSVYGEDIEQAERKRSRGKNETY
jgi:hypothetical protein